MIRIIDLDHLGKFLTADNAVVFTVNVGGEKLGLTAGEVAELVRTKLAAGTATSTTPPAKGTGRKGAKAQGGGRSAQTEEISHEAEAAEAPEVMDDSTAADLDAAAETEPAAENSTF